MGSALTLFVSVRFRRGRRGPDQSRLGNGTFLWVESGAPFASSEEARELDRLRTLRQENPPTQNRCRLVIA